MAHIQSLPDLRCEFSKLLDDKLPEQDYQTFLEENTRLIPREFIQNHGIHFDIALRKLSLAKDYTTDFFYLAKSSADWNCVLIEIEKPHSRYFKDRSNAFHDDLLAALEQINTWRAWFADTDQLQGFINGAIRPLRVPIAMAANRAPSSTWALARDRRVWRGQRLHVDFGMPTVLRVAGYRFFFSATNARSRRTFMSSVASATRSSGSPVPRSAARRVPKRRAHGAPAAG